MLRLQKLKNDELCWDEEGCLGGLVVCSWEGCLDAGGKKKEKYRREGSMVMSYINYYRWIYRQNNFIYNSIGNFVNVVDSSPYGYPGLNLTVFPMVKSSTNTSVSSLLYFLKFFIFRLWFPWYILGVSISGSVRF
jgi:hypothetical protein